MNILCWSKGDFSRRIVDRLPFETLTKLHFLRKRMTHSAVRIMK